MKFRGRSGWGPQDAAGERRLVSVLRAGLLLAVVLALVVAVKRGLPRGARVLDVVSSIQRAGRVSW